MEIYGTVVVVLDEVSGTGKSSGKAWRKREFVVETPGDYPKRVCMQLFCDRVDSCPKVGERVRVECDVESREYNGRWFTQVNGRNVVVEMGAATQQPLTQQQPTAQQPMVEAVKDDFPF